MRENLGSLLMKEQGNEKCKIEGKERLGLE